MGFLAPWFLAGMAAVGLPLWIHLLRQYRSTPHPFSSLMFFERRTQSSIKHRRLRHLLLLALRIALLILMAIAFANPFVSHSAAAAAAKRQVLFAVDNSFSMRYRDHLARAKSQAMDAVNALPPGTRGQVLLVEAQTHFLTEPTTDKTQLKAAIDGIQAGDDRSSYAALARTLRSLEEASHAALEAHLFSDMQASSMPPAFVDLQLGDNTRLILHSVAEGKEPNWRVESVTAPARIYDPKKVRVQAAIAGTATEAARKNVSLVLDGKTLDSKSVEVPANGRASVEFLSLESPYGFHRGEVRVQGGDGLPEDDRFFFGVERSDPRRVLFLHPAGQTQDVLYYRTALESVPEAGFILEPLAAEQAANQSLSKYAYVVLSDTAVLPAALENSLRTYVNEGGSLLIAVGPANAARRRVPVLGSNIEGSRAASRGEDPFLTVSSADGEFPSLRHTSKLEGVRFYQAYAVDVGNARVIARLNDGTPLLFEQKMGEGRVLVFTSGLGNRMNDFPLHASFVPFIEGTARYLGGQADTGASVPVGSFLELRTARDQGSSVEVIDPDGKRPLSLQQASSVQGFPVTKEGFYEIHRANGRQELVAVHADRRESDLTPVPAETLQLWQGAGQGGAPVPSAAAAPQENKARPLWRYALFLVLLSAVAESLIAGRYLSVEKEAL